ncbi:rhodopsin-like [Physella acuta]|uniref:rhodopsin-like n=1 Tax=Physella acuta TaxID=109671 RepID=UPI0027DE0556|nr:rhodopsin-like [Physella acuta]
MSVHTHWADHAPVPAAIHFTIGLFITVIGLAAVCGNILVILTCVRFKDLRTRSNILIINLAIGDLFMCSVDFPLLALASFYQTWPFGSKVCQMYAFLTAVAGMVTINTLAVIAADRYWAVVRRPNPGHHLPRCATALAVASVWCYSISWALCPILGWGAYILDGIGTTCTFDYLTRSWHNRSFVMAMVAGNFLLPFAVMAFCYTRIWLAVREVKSGLERESSHVTMGRRRFSRDSFSSAGSVKRTPDAGKRQSSGSETFSQDEGVDSQRDVNFNDHTRARIFFSRPKLRGQSSVLAHDSPPHKQAAVCYSQISFGSDDCVAYSSHDYSIHSKLLLSSAAGHTLCVPSRSSGCRSVVTRNLSRHEAKISSAYSMEQMAQIYENQFGNGEIFYCNVSKQVGGSKPNQPRSKTLERSIFGRIRLRYHAALGSKLILKQHRYRLHCEHKTIKVIMFLLMAFTLSWCPYTVISIIGLFGDQSHISYLSSVVPSLLAKTSMVFNPLLYSISHPKVRKRILKAFCGASKLQRPKVSRCQNLRSSSTLSANSRS